DWAGLCPASHFCLAGTEPSSGSCGGSVRALSRWGQILPEARPFRGSMEPPLNAREDLEPALTPEAPAAHQKAPASPYRVLARKYRPARFEDLIGQEPMVRTLSNAFDLGRIHQAYILTGVRGVGKTTTARILARAFNYELPARGKEPAINRPSIHMPEFGV